MPLPLTLIAVSNRYVKVQHIFPNSQFCIERDGWGIVNVGLDGQNIGSSCRGDFLQFIHQGCRDAPPSISSATARS